MTTGRPQPRRTGWRAAAVAALAALAALAVAALGGCGNQAVVPGAMADEVYIPGGTFRMGHAPVPGTQCGNWTGPVQCGGGPDFAPVHAVTLSPYFIDTYEVTFGDYRRCIAAGYCFRDPWESGAQRDLLNTELGDPAHARYPIWSVSVDAAERYCEWMGERLPTEAEWERAARGPKDFDYPWGNDPPTCAKDDDWAQGCVDTVDQQMVPVGTRPHDVSAEGVHDLYGNAWEWVSDLVGGYPDHPVTDPTGPRPSQIPQDVGDPAGHILRGGCDGIDWPDYDYVHKGCPVWFRTAMGVEAGFRCARYAR